MEPLAHAWWLRPDDPSDAVALLAGVLYGPATGLTVVAFKDLLSLLLRARGPFGPATDFLAAAAFVWTAAWVCGRLHGPLPRRLAWGLWPAWSSACSS